MLYKTGVSGSLENVELPSSLNGSTLFVTVRNSSGDLFRLAMTAKFPNQSSVAKRALDLVGTQIETAVSQTTKSWGATKYFCDIYSKTTSPTSEKNSDQRSNVLSEPSPTEKNSDTLFHLGNENINLWEGYTTPNPDAQLITKQEQHGDQSETEKHVFDLSIDEMLERDEDHEIEFKAFFFSDPNIDWKKIPDKKSKVKEIKYRVIREIASFLNTCDGVVLVGIKDGKNCDSGKPTVCGVQEDNFKNSDEYILAVTETLHYYFNTIIINQNIDTKLVPYKDAKVLLIKCAKAKEMVYIDGGRVAQQVWIRSGSMCKELMPNEHPQWIELHFTDFNK